MRYRQHGNYCGPGWSAGKYQSSVYNSRVRPIDAYDRTCKTHDRAYAPEADPKGRSKADSQFFWKNIGRGHERSAAALAVGAQGLARRVKHYFTSFPEKDTEMARKRGRSPPTSGPSKRVKYSSSSSRSRSFSPVRKVFGSARVRTKFMTPNKTNYRSGLVYGRNRGGRYRGKFNKAKKRKYNTTVNKHGIVSKIENGGSISTGMSNTIYVGHSIAAVEFRKMFYRGIVKALAVRAGLSVRDFNEPIWQTMNTVGNKWIRIYFTFFTGAQGANNAQGGNASMQYSSGGAVVAGTTWDTFATALDVAVDAAIGAVTTENIDEIYFDTFALYTNDEIASVVSASTPASSIDAKNAYVSAGYYSDLVVQNRTNDATGDTNIESTSANPIHGKLYESRSKWLNGFESPRQATAIIGQNPLLSYAGSGVIIAKTDTTQPRTLKKPPPGWVLGVKRESSVNIQPGDIKRMSHRWSCKMMLNTLAQKMFKPILGDPSDTDKLKFGLGFAQVLGLECQLYDRTETTQLQISWELNQTYNMQITTRIAKTMPMIAVGTGEVTP